MKMMERRKSAVVMILVRLIAAVGLTMVDVDSGINGCPKLRRLEMEGHIDFYNTHVAAQDFGNRLTAHPAAVVYPKSVSDIVNVVKSTYKCGAQCNLTIAAKGHSHSLRGQALAENGVVIEMSSLRTPVYVDTANMYADVAGGELWIDLLHETLKQGLAPKSWTDYLYLSVGGTLSVGGISGQAFRHGPQINNVQQLQVVTGKGELVTCNKESHSELFYGVLGGLGQFGIITRARISLEPAPRRVRWIRVLYSDFGKFTRDQELLITRGKSGKTFDYVEGFVIVNNEALINNWRSSFFSPQNPVKASNFITKGKVLYCLEVTLNYVDNSTQADEDVEKLLGELHYIPETVFTTDVSYVEFLDRVHASELKLRAKGLWDVPHPWLNIFVPASDIHKFEAMVFHQILNNTNAGPILIYPLNRQKWDDRMSAVIPQGEEVFYIIGLLRSAVTPSMLDTFLDQNNKILEFCKTSKLQAKQYLPHYTSEEDWRSHFGNKRWKKFAHLKAKYDPNAMLAPGQKIFTKKSRTSSSLFATL